MEASRCSMNQEAEQLNGVYGLTSIRIGSTPR